jgi:hypothetical protein
MAGVSILEVLGSAEINIKNGIPAIRALGIQQLHNAVTLLEKGYSVDDDADKLLELAGGNIEEVPDNDGL